MTGLTFPPILRSCSPSFSDGQHLFLMHAQTQHGASYGLSAYAKSAAEAKEKVQMNLVGGATIVAIARVLRWK